MHASCIVRFGFDVGNAKGEVSFSTSRNGSDALQRRMLEKEGIEFDGGNRFNLERFRWLD